MGADEKKGEVSEEAIIKKKTQEPGRERNHKTGMARETKDVLQIGCGLDLGVSFGFRHPQQDQEAKGNCEKIEDKRPVPCEDGENSAERWKHQIADAVEKDFKALPAYFVVPFKGVSDQDDSERDESAESDSLQRAQNQHPEKGRSPGDSGATQAVKHESPGEQEAPSVKVGNYSEQGREHDGGSGVESHDQREGGVADAEGFGHRGQSGLNEIDAHDQGEARAINKGERSALQWSQLAEIEKRRQGEGAHVHKTGGI